jgi:small subunit ribosomal protein S7
MRKGKKELARKIVYQAFEIIKEQTKKDPLEVFEKAIKNVGPLLEVRARRIGGATYQVPVEVKEERRQSLAMRWIIEAARAQKGKPMKEKLAQELIEASENRGAAIRKRDETHRMAEANKAFAHFA